MNKPTISIIAAIGENRELGNKGKIPWHIKKDLVRFKKKTTGHAVVMGRKTFEWMLRYYEKSKNPLPKRTHIIVTRNNKYKTNIEKTIIVHSIEEAINHAKKLEKNEVFIAGGGQIYQQAIKHANKLYLTIVKGKFEADTFFPDYSEFKKVIFKSSWKKSRKHCFQFINIER